MHVQLTKTNGWGQEGEIKVEGGHLPSITLQLKVYHERDKALEQTVLEDSTSVVIGRSTGTHFFSNDLYNLTQCRQNFNADCAHN